MLVQRKGIQEHTELPAPINPSPASWGFGLNKDHGPQPKLYSALTNALVTIQGWIFRTLSCLLSERRRQGGKTPYFTFEKLFFWAGWFPTGRASMGWQWILQRHHSTKRADKISAAFSLKPLLGPKSLSCLQLCKIYKGMKKIILRAILLSLPSGTLPPP